MPRTPRYSCTGAIHHVMLRGNQGRPIFYSDRDRVHCCLLIQEIMERHGHRIHAFCLMSNHIHLALQQGSEGLSSAIHDLAFRHAQSINRQRKEIGHVFQGRFKSILINEQHYLTQLVRYIHLNPVRAGIVKRPEDYKWSGHNAFLGTDPITWIERDYVLKKYSEDYHVAVKRYNEFVYAEIGRKPEIDFKIGLQSGIIGDDAFIQTVLAEEKQNSKLDDSNITTSDLIEHVCLNYGVTEIEIASGSRARELSHVRAVISLFARDLKGVSLKEIAKKLDRDIGGLSRLARKLEQECNSTPLLKQEIIAVKKGLLQRRMELGEE